MSQEHLPTLSPIERHLQSLASSLSSVPEMQPVVDMFNSDSSHGSEVYRDYLELAGKIVSMDESDYDAIKQSQENINGEIGSASTVGANDIRNELSERDISLQSVVSESFNFSSPYYTSAVDELVSRLIGGHEMKVAGKTPSDHDSDSLKVIWGQTVITGEEALLHFTIMHYLERFVALALTDKGVAVANHKDFFINAMTDVVILKGLRNPEEPIFNLWKTPKDQNGLGWVTQDRLNSYSEQQA